RQCAPGQRHGAMAGRWADVMRWSSPARQVEPPRIANLAGDRRAGWRWRMRIREGLNNPSNL
ncbi:hypothetical protein BRL73_24580, partial [Xanthomonas oryzae pv. oryzae]